MALTIGTNVASLQASAAPTASSPRLSKAACPRTRPLKKGSADAAGAAPASTVVHGTRRTRRRDGRRRGLRRPGRPPQAGPRLHHATALPGRGALAQREPPLPPLTGLKRFENAGRAAKPASFTSVGRLKEQAGEPRRHWTAEEPARFISTRQRRWQARAGDGRSKRARVPGGALARGEPDRGPVRTLVPRDGSGAARFGTRTQSTMSSAQTWRVPALRHCALPSLTVVRRPGRECRGPLKCRRVRFVEGR